MKILTRGIALVALLSALASAPVHAQAPTANTTGLVVTTCGATAPFAAWVAGRAGPFTVNTVGQICFTGTVTATIDTTGLATSANQALQITQETAINTTLGTPMQQTGGSVTANAGTNLNTSLLALESGGNLATLAGIVSSARAAVNPIAGQAGVQGGAGASTALTQRVAIATDANTVQLAANQSVNVAQINGVTPLMGNGATGTGSPRVTIASDNTAFTVNPASATAPVSTMNSASANAGVTSAVAGVFDDASPTAITENNFGYMRMSANRNIYSTLRDAAGNERGANISAANELQVGSGTLGLAANQTAIQAPVAPATATATKSVLLGAQATTAAVNPTTGQQSALSSDTNNNLLTSPGGAPNIATAQVSVTTGNITVAAARALRRSVKITNVTGTNAIYCGVTGVATTTGDYLGSTAGSNVVYNTTAAIFCTVAATTQTVTVAETF